MRLRTAPKRDKLLHVQLSDSERAQLREVAMIEQRSVSDIVRAAIALYRSEALGAQK